MKKTAQRKRKESFFEAAVEPIVETVVSEEKEQRKMKKLLSSKPFLFGLITILIVIGIAGAVYWFSFLDNAKPSGAQLSSEEIKSLVKEVGDKVVLPKDETPTIATVTDVSKLDSQPFFKNAENGDKVIIYGSTREAILYRPSLHKIITMAPVNNTNIASPSPAAGSVSPTDAAVSVTPTKPVKIKIAILNSTKEGGLAKKAAALFDDEKYEIVSTGNAKGEYKTTSVSKIQGVSIADLDVKGIASTISKVTAETKTLPADEAAPAGAGVVIILGSDFSEAY